MALPIAARVGLPLALLLAGCAPVAHLGAVAGRPAPPAAIRFGADTFAFPNESRAKNPDKPDLYANYCFVMVRAVAQFHRFARFDPALPRLDAAGYAERVRRVVARQPWEPPLPAAERVVIPGYASLGALSEAEEAAVKQGLVGRWWTLLHWTNWRVVFPAPGWHQERVLEETLEELEAGRPVQLLVTNFPTIELNHSVLAYGYRVRRDGQVELTVYDPNDPRDPGTITFDPETRRFVATRLFDTTPGPIRAYRMYYGPLL